jgi:CHAD domain-containing protein
MPEQLSCRELATSSITDRIEALRWAVARLPLASDPEAVHDARVALRRLRQAWTGFADCLRSRGGERRRKIRSAERELGPLRDAEVRLHLLDLVLGPVAVSRDRSDDPRAATQYGQAVIQDRSDPLQPGLRGLEMEARRWLADATAAEISQQQETVVTMAFLNKLGKLTRPPNLDTGPAGDAAALEMAAAQLPKLFRDAAGPGHDRQLHERRIRIRRLRYRMELFGPVLPVEHEVVLRELRQLQGLLGRSQDLAVLVEWIHRASRQQQRELRPALRRLVVRVELEHEAAKEAAEPALRRLDESGWWHSAQQACCS